MNFVKKIINFIKKKFFEPREVVVASNTLTLEEIKKILGSDAANISTAEAQKRFEKLPVEKQVEAFFGKNSQKQEVSKENMISFEDFKKLDIRIGKVLSAERIPDSDKLVKMQVDFGAEQRQILAGVAEYVADLNTLVGLEMPFVVNLEPRKMRGFESQGMMLAADDGIKPILLHPAENVPPGSEVR